MQLWLAALLFLILVAGTVFLLIKSRKNKKLPYRILTALSALLALALLLYIGLTWVFINRESPDRPAVSAAAEIIDPFIDKAIAAVTPNGQDSFSKTTYPFEQTYGYDSLSASEKTMYDEMLKDAKTFTDFSYTAEEHGYEEMDRSLQVYGTLARDYPEIENYFFMKEVIEDNTTTAIRAQYILPGDADMKNENKSEIIYETELFEAACDRIVERMPEEFSTYNKYRYLAAVISFVTAYDYDFEYGWQDGTAYGSILGSHSICQGYSRGYMFLCKKANLWCDYVDGESNGTAHMWNLIKLDTGTYHVDITWADELGQPGSAEWEQYFLLTQEEILYDHEIYGNTMATGTPAAKNQN